MPLPSSSRSRLSADSRLSRERTRRVNARLERMHRAQQRVDRQRRGDVGGAASRSAPASASASTAVETCVPLISASPSFGPSATGAQARRARARRRPRARRPTRSPSPISTSARCASGARSPLAPTEPRLGTRGCTPRLSSASSASSVSTRMPEKPFASTLARSAIAARTVAHRQRLVDAGGVAAQQVDLQRARDRRCRCASRRSCRSRC